MLKNKLTDVGLLLLRLGAGGFMLFGHGIGKIGKWSEMSAKFPDPLGLFGSEASMALAIFAEVGCAALVMLGLVTRLAALPVVATMGVAAFIVHAADPFKAKELALVYLVAFTAIALLGGGNFSLGEWFRKGRAKK